MKNKDNHLTYPDYGFQVDLMTASGAFMALHTQNVCKILSSGIQYLTLLCPYGKKYIACLQGPHSKLSAFGGISYITQKAGGRTKKETNSFITDGKKTTAELLSPVCIWVEGQTLSTELLGTLACSHG